MVSCVVVSCHVRCYTEFDLILSLFLLLACCMGSYVGKVI